MPVIKGGRMSEKPQFRAIKGTRDILPPDSALWNRFEQTARNIFESYGFGEIRLPIFEETGLFARSVGSDTDVVGKETYTFPDVPYFPDLEQAREAVKEVNPGIGTTGRQDLFEMYVSNF